MTNHSSSFTNKILIILAILVGILLLYYVGLPLLQALFYLLFLIASFVAGIFKYILFVLLCIGAIIGLLLFISWIIQEFTS